LISFFFGTGTLILSDFLVVFRLLLIVKVLQSFVLCR
jgi:hypothetical protein